MIYSIVGIVIVLTLCVWFLFPLETSEKVGITTAISTVALAVVTSIYAWHTRTMAGEMKEQRLSEAKPYLLVRLTNEFEKWPPSNNSIGVTIMNEGKGPAINVQASLWNPRVIHPFATKGYLASGEEWQVNLSTLDTGIPYEGKPWLSELKDVIENSNTEVIVINYHDIHKRGWLSYSSFVLLETDIISYIKDGEQNILEWNTND